MLLLLISNSNTPKKKVIYFTNHASLGLQELKEIAGIAPSSAFSLIAPAYASNIDPNKIAEIVEDIQNNIESAAQAVEDITDPSDAIESLEVIDVTQDEQIDTLTEVKEFVDDDIIDDIVEDALDEAYEDEGVIEEAIVTVEEAEENEEEIIALDLPVEEEEDQSVIATKANEKIEIAAQNIEKLKERLVEEGLSEEIADEAVASIQARLDAANQALEDGKIGRAHGLATSAWAQSKANPGRIKKYLNIPEPSGTPSETPTVTSTIDETPTVTATIDETPIVDDGGKVLVCHKPGGDDNKAKTLSIGASALPAHLVHGDTEGACPNNPDITDDDDDDLITGDNDNKNNSNNKKPKKEKKSKKNK